MDEKTIHEIAAGVAIIGLITAFALRSEDLAQLTGATGGASGTLLGVAEVG